MQRFAPTEWRRPQPNHPARSPGSRVLPVRPEDRAALRILVADDERSLRESCATVLTQEGYQVACCRSGDEALDHVRRQRFDIVLVDLYLAPVTGLDVVRGTLRANREALVIVMTGNPSLSSSLEAVRAGAWDYLPKPFSATHFQILIGRAAHAVLTAREARKRTADLKRSHAHSDQLVLLGVSHAFRKAIELARRVAPTDAPVFITGESGTGKELVAEFIHQHSRRASRPLVPINCAALPEPLLESEMFGHLKGAFTGAVRDKRGLLDAADGGTLFLDELLDMPKPIQAKLLRVIQDGVVRRVGSETTDAVVDVRFIAATNGDIERGLEGGVLREDLYYRLRVVPIHLPPLRERQEDIPLLAKYFLEHYWSLHRGNARRPRLSEAAARRLQEHPWRGNVRELQNVFEHSVVLLEPGAVIGPSDILPCEDPASEAEPASPAPGAATTPPSSPPAEVWLDENYHVARERLLMDFERRYLTWLVSETRGNLARAARLAGVQRTTLYRLIERHGIDRELAVDAEADPAEFSDD